jgi:phospholipid/cholesterol/gamma-HCH transport system ATP-binding protein
LFDIFKAFHKNIKKIADSIKKPKETENVVELLNVYKSFNGKKVIDGVSISLKKGETLAIIGPSGCGKSTILRLIIGLVAPTSGDIFVKGRNIVNLEKDDMVEIRKRIGMVFQSSALFDSLTVGENVAFGLREHTDYTDEKIQTIVAEKLNMVGLESSQNLLPSELSGGMQKRISLARALATDPEIILYDEPTTGLDPITSTSIEDLINSIHKRLGTSAIVVTHQMSTVYRIANRIVMLHNGKALDAGTPEQARASNDQIIKQFINGKL